MARISYIIGIALIALALGFYLATLSGTALSPLLPGIPILICGVIAQRGEQARKHAIHAALVFALLGVLAPLYPIYKGIASGAIDGSVIESLLMLILCGVYLALGIKSFVDARQARENA